MRRLLKFYRYDHPDHHHLYGGRVDPAFTRTAGHEGRAEQQVLLFLVFIVPHLGPRQALTTLGMLHRTEPSTVVILLASVISPPLPPFPRRVGRRDGVAKIFRSMFFSVLVCVVFTSHSPGLSRIIYGLQRPFSQRCRFNVACNCFDSMSY